MSRIIGNLAFYVGILAATGGIVYTAVSEKPNGAYIAFGGVGAMLAGAIVDLFVTRRSSPNSGLEKRTGGDSK